MTDPDLAAALRDRVRDEHPDLHQLTAVSLRAGIRIKRRRTAGIAAGIGTGLALVAGSVLLASGLPGSGGDSVELAPAVGASADSQPAGESDRVEQPDGAEVKPQVLPVKLTLDGWTCDAPADDKFACTDGEGAFVSVVVRPAAELDDWLGEPDKEGSALWLSPAHDNYFVTVQGDGFGQTDPEDFIDGLQFADSWQR